MEKQLEEIVDFLEGKILKMLESYTILQEELTESKNALQLQKSQNEAMNLELEELQKEYTTLKNANALLGSDEHKKETKHKINALIREIDTCIAQLS